MSAVQERSGKEYEPCPTPPNVYPLLQPSVVAVGAGGFPVERVAAAFRGFLEALGVDPEEPNLVGTDHRVAEVYQEILGGLRQAEPALTPLPNTKRYAGMVSLTDIPFYSICARHFLPFFGAAHIAYVPRERLVGLSTLTRMVDFYTRRPQLQEDLTEGIAARLDEKLAPAGVIVLVEARHLCLEMRGVSRRGVTATTTAARGTFQDEGLQQQFLTRVRAVSAAAPTREAEL